MIAYFQIVIVSVSWMMVESRPQFLYPHYSPVYPPMYQYPVYGAPGPVFRQEECLGFGCLTSTITHITGAVVSGTNGTIAGIGLGLEGLANGADLRPNKARSV